MVKAMIITVGVAAVFLGVVSRVGTLEARVLTRKECISEYRTAKAAGYLPKTSWKQFRKAHICKTKSST